MPSMEFLLGIVAAIVIFVFTEWLGKMVFEPVVAFRRAVGKIDGTLVMYANIYSNPGVAAREDSNRAHDAIRGSSSELQAAIRSIVCYDFFARLGMIPRRNDAREAGRLLIGIANGVWNTNLAMKNYDSVERIRAILGIQETTPQEKP